MHISCYIPTSVSECHSRVSPNNHFRHRKVNAVVSKFALLVSDPNSFSRRYYLQKNIPERLKIRKLGCPGLGFSPVLLVISVRLGKSLRRIPSGFSHMDRHTLLSCDCLHASFRAKWCLAVSTISKGSACVSAWNPVQPSWAGPRDPQDELAP